MLDVFVFTLVLMGLLIACMAIGVIFSNKPIQGSCGGMKALQMDTACEICGDDPRKCDEQVMKKTHFYDASNN